jgi:RNA polymerase sigma-70 factor (ECF subfamily)
MKDLRSANLAAVNDNELLAAEPSADGGAFAELYCRHAKGVLSYHLRRTGCPQTAADLTAETFAQVFASRRRFRDIGAPAQAWIFTIARRQLGRYVRSERVRRKYRDRLGMQEIEVGDADLERIEQLVDFEPLRRDLLTALAEVPETQASALRLRIGEQLPYSQVASALGCSEQATRALVSRGLKQLHVALEG